MSALLDAGVAIVWLAAFYQASIVWRGGGDSATRWHVVGFAALSVALTVNQPQIYSAVDRTTGVANLGELVSHGFALLAAWSAHAAIVASVHSSAGFRQRMTPSAVALATTLLVMTFCFVAAPVDREVTDFTVTYAVTPFVAPYFLAYLGFAAFALVDITLLSWRYRGSAGALGLGLRILMLGAGCGLVYVIQKATYVIVTRWSDVQLDATASTELSHVALIMCAVLCVTGATLPRVGRDSDPAAHPPPGVPLISTPALPVDHSDRRMPGSSPRGAATTMDRRRRPQGNRVSALSTHHRDPRLPAQLRPYVDVDVVARARAGAAARGVTGTYLEALTEAAALRVAVEHKKRGQISGGWSSATAIGGPTDLTSEAEGLVLVSRYFNIYSAPQRVKEEERARA